MAENISFLPTTYAVIFLEFFLTGVKDGHLQHRYPELGGPLGPPALLGCAPLAALLPGKGGVGPIPFFLIFFFPFLHFNVVGSVGEEASEGPLVVESSRGVD